MVLFDTEGHEIIRVESQLRSFHTEAVLEYVAQGVYKREPNFQRYIEERGDIIRSKGELGKTLSTRDICPELYDNILGPPVYTLAAAGAHKLRSTLEPDPVNTGVGSQ